MDQQEQPQIPQIQPPKRSGLFQVDIAMLQEVHTVLVKYKDCHLNPTRVLDVQEITQDMMAIHAKLGLFSQNVQHVDYNIRVLKADRENHFNYWFCRLREEAWARYQCELDDYIDRKGSGDVVLKPDGKPTDSYLKAKAESIVAAMYGVELAQHESLKKQIDFTYTHSSELVNVMKRMVDMTKHEWTGE